MLKFGKKINYCPLLISFGIGLTIGLLFGLNIAWLLGLQVGTIMFFLILIGYYLLILPIIFNYWDIDDTQIRYGGFQKLRTRLLVLFFPRSMSLRTISKKDIVGITLLGLPQPTEKINSELIISEEGGFLYNLILIINEPIKIRLTTIDHQNIDLDVSHDYVQHPHETLGKINLFLQQFHPDIINLAPETADLLNQK